MAFTTGSTSAPIKRAYEISEEDFHIKAVSVSFLLVLILVTLELSIASPGTTSSWTIMFATLSLPTSYVGLFTVYRMFTANYCAACTEAYTMLEEVEAAYKLDGMINSKSGSVGEA